MLPLLAAACWARNKKLPTISKRKTDSCALINQRGRQSYKAIPVQETKLSTPPGGGMEFANGLFSHATPATRSHCHSVAGSSSPRSSWHEKAFPLRRPASMEQAHSGKKPVPERRSRKQRKKRNLPAARLSQAWVETSIWIGGPMVGARRSNRTNFVASAWRSA